MPHYAYARKEIVSIDGHIAVELAPGVIFAFDALANEWPEMLGQKEIGVSGTDMVIMHQGTQYLFRNGNMEI